jgi:hypothetical protein
MYHVLPKELVSQRENTGYPAQKGVVPFYPETGCFGKPERDSRKSIGKRELTRKV